MKIECKLYKIIRGHFRLCVDGLDLFFKEPGIDLISESYNIYEQAYEEAYKNRSCVESELSNLLIEHDIWSPFFDKQLKNENKQLEDLKVKAFECFFQPSELSSAKRAVYACEARIEGLLQNKHRLDHLSCSNIAESARFVWLINKCISPPDKCDPQKVVEAYKANLLSVSEIREIARCDEWRQIWNASKKTFSLFNKPAIELTNQQLVLISYSSMYDSIFEHPESPPSVVVEDDICLDGWLIKQKRKNEKDKKQREVDDLLANPKIKNAGEVFLMAKTTQDVEGIQSLNSDFAKNKIAQRSSLIQEKGKVKDIEFADVQQDLEILKAQATKAQLKGRK